jgi:hypothetical protein
MRRRGRYSNNFLVGCYSAVWYALVSIAFAEDAHATMGISGGICVASSTLGLTVGGDHRNSDSQESMNEKNGAVDSK